MISVRQALGDLTRPIHPVIAAPARFLGKISEGPRWAYYLILPSFLMILAVILYPVASGILLSVREMRLNRPALGTGFVGLKHFGELITDPVFVTALINTVIWVLVGSVTQFVLGLIVAVALNRQVRGTRLARTLLMLPWILPSVVAGHMWALMLDSRLGVINDILLKLGLIPEYKAWFADPRTAMLTVLVVALWQGFPFFALLLLAGLQGIPDDLYEAASVDGANRIEQFIHITIPLLQPVIVATVVLRVIGLVNSPDLLLVLTEGGPGNATQVLSLYAFQTAYKQFNFGLAGAMSVVILILLVFFTILYVRISGVTRD